MNGQEISSGFHAAPRTRFQKSNAANRRPGQGLACQSVPVPPSVNCTIALGALQFYNGNAVLVMGLYH